MVGYNIVHFCRNCRTRYVTCKEESQKYLCDKCQKVAGKSR
jgi:hypothetical protein